MTEELTLLMRKVNWAEQQRRRLKARAKLFFETKPYRLRQETNGDGTEHIVRATHVEPVPEDFSLSVGDIAHNLRSALDHLAYSHASAPCRQTAWPICRCAKVDKTGRVVLPSIAGGVPEVVKQIVGRYQPYHDGQDPDLNILWWLRELDNIDKHRFVLTSLASMQGSRHGFIPQPKPGTFNLEPLWGELVPGTPVAVCTFTEPNFDVEIDYRPFLAVSVKGVARAMQGEDICLIFWHMVKKVRALLQECEPYLRR